MANTDNNTLTPDDLKAEGELLHLLIGETEHLGKHGGTPWRRSASGRVEIKLRLLLDQITSQLNQAPT